MSLISSREHSRLSTTREKADVARLLCCVERVNGHLRGGVQREIRRVCVDEPRQPQILHDKRVRACFVQEFCVLKGVLKLAVARKNVERNIGFYVACAAVGDGVCHFVMRKSPVRCGVR